MTLFYPAAFGIVGQKMTSLLHRSQGDAEDPHDEHFLLTTQSKQDQVQLSTFPECQKHRFQLIVGLESVLRENHGAVQKHDTYAACHFIALWPLMHISKHATTAV